MSLWRRMRGPALLLLLLLAAMASVRYVITSTDIDFEGAVEDEGLDTSVKLESLLERMESLTKDMEVLEKKAKDYAEEKVQAMHEAQLRAKLEKREANGGEDAKKEADPNVKLPYRTDGRCGPHYPAPGASWGECNPNANANEEGPCCNPDSGWCGNVRGNEWGHCDCPNCRDFSKLRKANPVSQVSAPEPPKPAAEKAPASNTGGKKRKGDKKPKLPKFRDDGHCGPRYPAPGAPDFGECDPSADADQKGPCCNPESGWCGNVRFAEWGHCDCPTCRDYSKGDAGSRYPGGRGPISSSKCVRAFSAKQYEWSAATHAVCSALFASVDFSLKKESVFNCLTNDDMDSSLCIGKNVAISKLGSTVRVRGACLGAMSSAQVSEKIKGKVGTVAAILSTTPDRIDLSTECKTWASKTAFFVYPDSTLSNDVFAVQHSARLTEEELESVDVFFLGANTDDDKEVWAKVFPQGIKRVADLQQGTCYPKVVFAYSGTGIASIRKGGANYKFDDCDEDAVGSCSETSSIVEDILGTPFPCPEA